MLAVMGVAFVGGVALIGAVTFLGTSSEPDLTAVTSSVPEEEDEDGGDRFVQVPMDEPSEDPYEAPYEDPSEDPFEEPSDEPAVAHPTAEALLLVEEAFSADDDWMLAEEYLMEPEEPLAASPCAPPGWNTGALDRAIGMFALPDGQPNQITVTLVTYANEELAAGELERARTEQYQQCELTQRRQEGRLDDAEIAVLPDDPLAPGVAIAMSEGDGGRTEYDHIIVVGRMRAQLDVCSCAGLDETSRRQAAASIAAILAEVQGLPAPG